MGWFANEADVPVELDCRCPNTPHEKDTVWLFGEVPLELGLAFEAIVDRGAADASTMTGLLGAAFVQHGIRRWTFLDEKGELVPLNTWTITRFTRNGEASRPVAEKANELYADKLIAPLMARRSKSSRTGQTGGSTSASRTGSRSRQRRSKRSTTATTPTPLRAMTNSDSDSSSLQRKRSVG